MSHCMCFHGKGQPRQSSTENGVDQKQKKKKKIVHDGQRRKLQKQQKQKLRREMEAAKRLRREIADGVPSGPSGSAVAEVLDNASSATSSCMTIEQAVAAVSPELVERIKAAGNRVRELKSAKEDFQPALKELLAAKAAFKQATGVDYVPPGYKPQRKVSFVYACAPRVVWCPAII